MSGRLLSDREDSEALVAIGKLEASASETPQISYLPNKKKLHFSIENLLKKTNTFKRLRCIILIFKTGIKPIELLSRNIT